MTDKREKAFVRPNCAGTFWLNCPVCRKNYFKYDSHTTCFKRWCELCQHAWPTQEEFKLHAEQAHRKFYCTICEQVYQNIRGHRSRLHPK